MNDYIKAALYTALFIGGVAAIASFINLFPTVSLYLVGATVLGLLFHAILTAIRSQRRIDEIKARYP